MIATAPTPKRRTVGPVEPAFGKPVGVIEDSLQSSIETVVVVSGLKQMFSGTPVILVLMTA